MADPAQQAQSNAAAILVAAVPLPGGAPGPLAPPAAIVFACNPAQAITGLFDFTDTTGIKIYKAASAPLKMIFDGTSRLYVLSYASLSVAPPTTVQMLCCRFLFQILSLELLSQETLFPNLVWFPSKMSVSVQLHSWGNIPESYS